MCQGSSYRKWCAARYKWYSAKYYKKASKEDLTKIRKKKKKKKLKEETSVVEFRNLARVCLDSLCSKADRAV